MPCVRTNSFRGDGIKFCRESSPPCSCLVPSGTKTCCLHYAVDTQNEREVPEHLSEVFIEKVKDSRIPLIRTLVIRVGWALRVNLSRIPQY